MDLATNFKDAGLDESHIDPIVNQWQEHGMVSLGEHKANELVISRRILNRAAGKA